MPYTRPRTLEEVREYLLARTELIPECSCWIFAGGWINSGYGQTAWGETAHSAAYRAFVDDTQIYAEEEISHTCRIRPCINPGHLQKLLKSDHRKLDGNQYSQATHCIHGHPFSGKNLYITPSTGARQCLSCNRAYMKEYRRKRKLQNIPKEKDE